MVYVIQDLTLSDAERALVQSLQGIVNRRQPSLYVDVENYMEYLTEDYVYVTLDELLMQYAPTLTGYVAYHFAEDDVAINMAATISAAYDILGVPYELEELVTQYGLKKLYDLAHVTGTSEERQRTVFAGCREHLRRDGLIHQVVRPGNFLIRLRDFAISQRWACLYTEETEAGRQLLHEVLSDLEDNIAVLGWTDDELPFVADLSLFGDYVIPMDWSANHSFWGVRPEETIKQNVQLTESTMQTIPTQDKHYLAIVVSDGDNIQWLERDFTTTSTFGQRLVSPMDYKLTFTMSPSFVKLAPAAAKHVYGLAMRERFMASVSGIGYCNCMKYPFDRLVEFAAMSCDQMERADLQTLCLLDNIENIKEDHRDRLDLYGQDPRICGGVWELDPDRYGAGHGKIYWTSNGKPFVSVRFTFWPKEGDTSLIGEHWIREYADAINAMPASPDREEGYTVLNVNPWTTRIEHLDQMVSLLAPHVELVYADELVELIRNNCVPG